METKETKCQICRDGAWDDADILKHHRCPICWSSRGGHAVKHHARSFDPNKRRFYYVCGNGHTWNYGKDAIDAGDRLAELEAVFNDSIPGQIETMKVEIESLKKEMAATGELFREMEATLNEMKAGLAVHADTIAAAKQHGNMRRQGTKL